jgi:hypothetical protein
MPTRLPPNKLPLFTLWHIRLQLKIRRIRRSIRTRIAKYLIIRACTHVDQAGHDSRRALKLVPWVKPSEFDF